MKLLEDRIVKDGVVIGGDVLRVDNFLNHQVDVPFVYELGKEFYRIFGDCKVTKILTIEASGIAIASLTAQFFNVPLVFAKKSRASNQRKDSYITPVVSYTHNTVYDVTVSKDFLTKDDYVLIIDDFLANGNALIGLIDLVHQAGATLVGCGAVIEKAYQGGGDSLRNQGIRVESLAKIKSMDENGLVFC